MLEFLQSINNNYASVLSLLSSVIMVIVTIIYVGHTKRQADYAKDSAELIAKQIKLEKQPCIIPEIIDSSGSAFNATNYTRIQLEFNLRLKNVGDAPAINIFSLAEVELQHSKDIDGKLKQLPASLLPNFVQAIRAGNEQEISIHFETREVSELVKELSKNMEMNWERIRTNPSQHHYIGARLIIRVLFKNIMGQWYESVLSNEIAWLEYKNSPERNTHNINENTIPPQQLREGDSFRAVMISPHYAPFSVKMQTVDYVNAILEQYAEDCPEIVGARDKMLAT